jgi:hypothetical protein
MIRAPRRSWKAILSFILIAAAGTGCRREDPQIRILTDKAAHTDEAAQQLRQAWKAQLLRLDRAGVEDLPGSDRSLMLLTAEQRNALEALVREERGTSRRALLMQILAKDLELRALKAHWDQLRAGLPEPETVQPHDSHYGMALRFLERRGCTEAQAKAILSRAAISDRIAPGFAIYHFFHDGVYAACVAQGSAPFSPEELNRAEIESLVAQRDGARDRLSRLKGELARLGVEKQEIEREMDLLQAERLQLLEGGLKLRKAESAHQTRLNSLHYLVGLRTALEEAGIIELPLFDKDRSGPRWRDEVFIRSLDLRASHTLTLWAAELGLKRIGSVIVVPGSYLRNEHYRLTLSPDGQTAVIDLLTPSRFRNDKVVFAVEE